MAEGKDVIRSNIKKKILAYSQDEINGYSRDICNNLQSINEFIEANVVMAFISIPGEVNTSYIIDECFKLGKSVVVPKVNWENNTMFAVQIACKDQQLKPNKYGIFEPENSDEYSVEDIDLIVVPGLGFDENLNRLGRGGGFYDKYLSQNGCRAFKCGVAFEIQMLTNMLVCVHDQKVDLLITEKRIIR